jgi:hypothetical protein
VTVRVRESKAAAAPGKADELPRLAPSSRFLSRLVRCGVLAFVVVTVALAVGVVGYHKLAHLDWLVSFHQTALLLSGLGPVELSLNAPGRVFESIYALFCGVILLGSAGIPFAPVSSPAPSLSSRRQWIVTLS